MDSAPALHGERTGSSMSAVELLSPRRQFNHSFTPSHPGRRPEETELLATGNTARGIAAGDILFLEGHRADHLYRVVSGTLRLYKVLRDGRRQITAFPSADRFVGVADNGHYLHTAEAISKVTVLCYSQSNLARWVDQVPGFARLLRSLELKEHCAAGNHILLLGRKVAIERLATFLLQMADDTRTIAPSVIRMPMKRADIADYLGLTVETISRLFFKFKQDGIIEMQSVSTLTILDRNRLENLSAGESGRLELPKRRIGAAKIRGADTQARIDSSH